MDEEATESAPATYYPRDNKDLLHAAQILRYAFRAHVPHLLSLIFDLAEYWLRVRADAPTPELISANPIMGYSPATAALIQAQLRVYVDPRLCHGKRPARRFVAHLGAETLPLHIRRALRFMARGAEPSDRAMVPSGHNPKVDADGTLECGPWMVPREWPAPGLDRSAERWAVRGCRFWVDVYANGRASGGTPPYADIGPFALGRQCGCARFVSMLAPGDWVGPEAYDTRTLVVKGGFVELYLNGGIDLERMVIC